MQPTDGHRKTQDVISYLKDIAEEAIQLTEFFILAQDRTPVC